MARRTGALYKDEKRSLWVAAVELDDHGTGKRRRKVFRGKVKKDVEKKLREFQNRLDADGDLQTDDPTLHAWITAWFAHHRAEKISPKTAKTYEGLIAREILPRLGTKRLSKITAADVKALIAGMKAKGLSPATAAQVHRILSVALKYAHREGYVPRNVATLVDAPRRGRPQLTALTVDEGVKVLETAAADPLGSLWAAVLLTGARQGELLGLELSRVTDVVDVSWQLQRLPWEHGCGTDPMNGATNCGRKRGSDCPKKRIIHPPDWEHRHIVGGLWWTRPKSHAGWRVIPLVDPLKTIIERHIAATAPTPNPHGLVWRTDAGAPIDPRDESHMWHDLLARAGVPDVRLHDGRHTTVDLLYEAGVPEDLIKEIVGHSALSMTRSYKSRGNDKRLREAMLSLSALFTQPTGARSGTRELDA